MKLFQRILQSTDPVESEGKNILIKTFRHIFEYGQEKAYIRSDLPESFLFAMHVNMVFTVNEWTLSEYIKTKDQKVFSDVSVKAVQMIRAAMEERS
jgi:sensor domain CHASE-containing protein